MGNFRLAEHFVSINGEGQRAGELALFLRFAGCNLRCAYCDTMWANAKDAPHALCTAEELIAIAKESGAVNVTLTGGEPLLQPGIAELIEGLLRAGHRVEIETNGSIPIAPILDRLTHRPGFTMDYKLPASGMEAHMCAENFAHLTQDDTVKFVCGSIADMQRAAQIMEQYHLAGQTKLYFSPVFGQIDPKDMVEFMKDNRMNSVRLQLQLHKFIWDPNERGV